MNEHHLWPIETDSVYSYDIIWDRVKIKYPKHLANLMLAA